MVLSSGLRGFKRHRSYIIIILCVLPVWNLILCTSCADMTGFVINMRSYAFPLFLARFPVFSSTDVDTYVNKSSATLIYYLLSQFYYEKQVISPWYKNMVHVIVMILSTKCYVDSCIIINSYMYMAAFVIGVYRGT